MIDMQINKASTIPSPSTTVRAQPPSPRLGRKADVKKNPSPKNNAQISKYINIPAPSMGFDKKSCSAPKAKAINRNPQKLMSGVSTAIHENKFVSEM